MYDIVECVEFDRSMSVKRPFWLRGISPGECSDNGRFLLAKIVTFVCSPDLHLDIAWVWSGP
jgi:hypothetical protein